MITTVYLRVCVSEVQTWTEAVPDPRVREVRPQRRQKPIGDCVFAVWEAPLDQLWPAALNFPGVWVWGQAIKWPVCWEKDATFTHTPKLMGRENDFVLQMRSHFGQVTGMATRQSCNNSLRVEMRGLPEHEDISTLPVLIGNAGADGSAGHMSCLDSVHTMFTQASCPLQTFINHPPLNMDVSLITLSLAPAWTKLLVLRYATLKRRHVSPFKEQHSCTLKSAPD